MTFTYDLTTPGDLERVRYHLGDTEEATALASDELIEFRRVETFYDVPLGKLFLNHLNVATGFRFAIDTIVCAAR